MIESLGNSMTDYARQERELAYSRENSVKSAEIKGAEASGDAVAIAGAQQQTADTAEVKTRPPQYDTIEISEEGMALSQQQSQSAAATIAAEKSSQAAETGRKGGAVTGEEMALNRSQLAAGAAEE